MIIKKGTHIKIKDAFSDRDWYTKKDIIVTNVVYYDKDIIYETIPSLFNIRIHSMYVEINDKYYRKLKIKNVLKNEKNISRKYRRT